MLVTTRATASFCFWRSRSAAFAWRSASRSCCPAWRSAPFPQPFAGAQPRAPLPSPDARLPSRPPSSPLPAAWQTPPSAPRARPVMPRIRNRPIPIARDHPARLPDIYFAPTKKGFALLTIHYGDMDGVIYNTSIFFNNVYSAEWARRPFRPKDHQGRRSRRCLGAQCHRNEGPRRHPARKTLKRHKDFASHAFHAREHLQRLQLRR